MDINGKTAVVTGGASGLGQATVAIYVARGANVAIFDLNEEIGQKMCAEHGDKVAFFKVDVSNEANVEAALNAVAEKFGDIHVVNNFAGISVPCKTTGKKGAHPLDLYMKTVMVNQVGTFNVCRFASTLMANNLPINEDGNRGVIINTASIAAYEGQIGQVAYSATKGAIVGMTLPMARDLAPIGIRVNTIVPGLIHTPLFDTIEESYYQALVSSTVFPKRLGKPQEIALLSAQIVENDYLNGECIRLDAAVRMQPK